MATQSATFAFGLPEDVDSDQLLIYSASTETGSYSLAATVSYSYGTRTYEYDSLDDTLWYKIQFNNSTDSESGPLSDAIYGGDFDNAAPFLAVSTTTDGANYASSQDVYDYSNLTTSDATQAQVSIALKRARAVIDLHTAELDLDRFEMYDTEIARKKHNATLRILREAEINIALGNLYRMLADDRVIEQNRSDGDSRPSVTIGSTSLGDDNVNAATNLQMLLNMSGRFLAIGAAMLQSIQPRTLRLTTWDGATTIPKFRLPFNGF